MLTIDKDFNRARATPDDRAAFLRRARIAAPNHASVIDNMIGGQTQSGGGSHADEIVEVLELIADGTEFAIGGESIRVRKPKIKHARALAGPLGKLLVDVGNVDGNVGAKMIALFMERAGDDTPLGRSISAVVADCFGRDPEWFDNLAIDDGLRAVEVACGLIPFADLARHFRGIGRRLAAAKGA